MNYLDKTVSNYDLIDPVAACDDSVGSRGVNLLSPKPPLYRKIIVKMLVTLNEFLNRNVAKLFKTGFSRVAKWDLKDCK